MRTIGILIISILASHETLSGAHAGELVKGDPAQFTTFKKCTMCHKKDSIGDQHAVWENGPHAKAYTMLAEPAAKEVAAKLGIADPQQSPKCLQCHSTAYYFSESIQTDLIEVELGVTCQSCHGPGDAYKSKEVHGKDRATGIAAGMIFPSLEKSCTHCHNDRNPTWNPDRYTLKDGTKSGFDPEQAYEKIKHPMPAQ
ncbi:MAG: hypothetical protein ACI9TH_000190 [Kiritimatiellia bacterium]|jgi:hypothetical protein